MKIKKKRAIWFSRHPPTAEQLAEIENMGYELVDVETGIELGCVLPSREHETTKQQTGRIKIMMVNLTPNTVRLNGGKQFPPSGQIARVKANHRFDGWLSHGSGGDQIPVYRTVFGQVEGLPEKVKDTIYIVSGMVAAACRDRNDVVCPATGHAETIRRNGGVWSVPGFSRG